MARPHRRAPASRRIGAGSGARPLTEAASLAALAESLRARSSLVPKAALALDPALGLASALQPEARFGAAELGGAGELTLGRLERVPVALLAPGVRPVRAARLLGAEVLVLARVARRTDPAAAGALGLIEDHLGLLVANPLIGTNADELGPRFPDMSAPYDPPLRALAQRLVQELGDEIAGGVYAGHPEPNLATPAEYRMLRRLGADWVGRGGVQEVVLARHAGMRVVGLVAPPGAESRLADLVRALLPRVG